MTAWACARARLASHRALVAADAARTSGRTFPAPLAHRLVAAFAVAIARLSDMPRLRIRAFAMC